MARRLTRKAIKEDIRHDELSTFLMRAMDQLERNRKAVIVALASVLFVVLAGFAFAGYLNHRRESAADELARAIDVYQAPIVEDDPAPDDPSKPTFASEEERRGRARQLFEAVRGFGSGAAGDVASLYLAEIAASEGDTATARRLWESFVEHHQGDVLATSARVNLIHLDRQEGKAEEVEKRLRAELESTDKTLPEDVTLYELARTLEALDRQDEADELYRRLVDEHPQFAARSRVQAPD